MSRSLDLAGFSLATGDDVADCRSSTNDRRVDGGFLGGLPFRRGTAGAPGACCKDLRVSGKDGDSVRDSLSVGLELDSSNVSVLARDRAPGGSLDAQVEDRDLSFLQKPLELVLHDSKSKNFQDNGILGVFLTLLLHKFGDITLNSTSETALLIGNLPTTRHDGTKPINFLCSVTKVVLRAPLGWTWKSVTVFPTSCPNSSFAEILGLRVFPVPNLLTGISGLTEDDPQVNNDELLSSIFFFG